MKPLLAGHICGAALALAPALAPAAAEGPGASGAPPDVPLPEAYGFADLIASRFNDGLFGLLAADCDSDGDQDLAVVNNPKARIDFLLQRRAGEPLGDDASTRTVGDSVNELPDEVHFRRASFPTEQKVSSVAIGDFNGDGRNDLAFVGDSLKLTVVFRNEQGTLGARVRFDIDDLSPVREAVRAGDVDGNGRTDLVVLGRRKTWVFRQDAAGRLAAAPELLNATNSPDGLALVDLDGDRRLDLLYVKTDAEAPLRWRMGRAGGEVGPERLFPFTEIRSYTTTDLDGDGNHELAVIRRRSGRLVVLDYIGDPPPPPPGELLLSAPRLVAYAALKDEKLRDEVIADLDGDGRPELIVAEPSAARVVVHRHDPDGLRSRGDTFPSFVGATRPRVADLDGDGRPELLVVAPDEGAIGVAKVDAEGRIAFPVPLGHKAEQLFAIEVAAVDGTRAAAPAPPVVFALQAAGKGKQRAISLVRLPDAAGGAAQTFDLGSLPTDPTDLLLADLDRDGFQDAIVFVPTEMPRILLGRRIDEKITFDPLTTADVPGLGILKGIARSALFHGDVDGDGQVELLVPGPNFARAFTLGAKGVPSVVGQWNLDDTGAKVGAVAAGDLDGDGKPEIVLAERTTRTLRVLGVRAGAVRPLARVDLGDLEPRGLRVADLDGDGRQDVILLAQDRFAVVQSGRSDAAFAERIDYETPLKNAHLDEMAFGDINGDRIIDAVVTETNRHLLTIAACVDDRLHHVLQFPIFEESIFEKDSSGGSEPRELVLADLTGDDKTDVAILVHDRVIVYPQE